MHKRLITGSSVYWCWVLQFPVQPNLQHSWNRRRAGQPHPYESSSNLHFYQSSGGRSGCAVGLIVRSSAVTQGPSLPPNPAKLLLLPTEPVEHVSTLEAVRAIICRFEIEIRFNDPIPFGWCGTPVVVFQHVAHPLCGRDRAAVPD